MKIVLKTIVAVLLLFNGTGAVYGGWNLIRHPDGSSLQMSLDWIRHTPFPDYLIPGIILITVNGFFSFFVFAAMLSGLRNYSWLIMVQGSLLSGWIIIQVLLIRTIIALHIILGSAGAMMVIIGIILNAMNKNKKIAGPN